MPLGNYRILDLFLACSIRNWKYERKLGPIIYLFNTFRIFETRNWKYDRKWLAENSSQTVHLWTQIDANYLVFEQLLAFVYPQYLHRPKRAYHPDTLSTDLTWTNLGPQRIKILHRVPIPRLYPYWRRSVHFGVKLCSKKEKSSNFVHTRNRNHH